MAESEIHKFLHHLDVLKCNHGGVVELPSTVKDRKVYIIEDLRPVCDWDLLNPCYVQKCPSGCKKIVKINKGLARDDVLKLDAIPLLGNLEADTDKGGVVKWDKSLSAQLAYAEGYFTKMYKDTKGIPTVGIGFNLKKDDAKKRIEELGLNYNDVLSGKQELTDAQIQKLFADDQVIAENNVRKQIPGFDSLDETRQRALTDGAFNLGSYTHFPNFVKAVNAGDWETAAKEIGKGPNGKGDSLWVRQVGNRARRIVAQIRGDVVYGAPQ